MMMKMVKIAKKVVQFKDGKQKQTPPTEQLCIVLNGIGRPS